MWFLVKRTLVFIGFTTRMKRNAIIFFIMGGEKNKTKQL